MQRRDYNDEFWSAMSDASDERVGRIAKRKDRDAFGFQDQPGMQMEEGIVTKGPPWRR
jgi:hypothetical protein